jgi:hypothetical protein
MNTEADLSLVLRFRLELLVKEFKAGDIFSKWKAQAIVNRIALDNSDPTAYEFYNALDNSEAVLDYSWLDNIKHDKKDHPAFMEVGDKCYSCCHKMLVSAYCYTNLPLEMTIAYIVEAISLAEDASFRCSLMRLLEKVLNGSDCHDSIGVLLTELEGLIQIKEAQIKATKPISE